MAETPNLFWNAYKSLERELLDLASTIHIDDKQKSTYSTRIANLLVSTVAEIETISKELYWNNGGSKKKNPYFDGDCLKYLNNQWNITEKKVCLYCNQIYLEEEKRLLMPLKNAEKFKEEGSEWKQAYNAVKHDRANNLKQGNIENFINALAALFILNVYYKNQTFGLGCDKDGKTFDSTLGSDVFQVTFLPYPNGNDENQTKKCIYKIKKAEEINKDLELIITGLVKMQTAIDYQSKGQTIANNVIIGNVMDVVVQHQKNTKPYEALIQKMLNYEAVLNIP
ncbi:MAG: hypothetical protein UH543_07680 [Bacteroidales bacterium]|nr:hypothetical protein [Bacteroidales bacterium]